MKNRKEISWILLKFQLDAQQKGDQQRNFDASASDVVEAFHWTLPKNVWKKIFKVCTYYFAPLHIWFKHEIEYEPSNRADGKRYQYSNYFYLSYFALQRPLHVISGRMAFEGSHHTNRPTQNA